MTIQEQVQSYIDQFTTTKRNDETITIFKDNTDEVLRDAVFAAHGDRLPTDWIFDKFVEILEAIRDYECENIDCIEEHRSEMIDGIVDIYTSDLTEWLNSSNWNVGYIEEAQREYGMIEDGFKLLATAQYMAIDEIFSEVVKLLEN